jgi:hypothetical protein
MNVAVLIGVGIAIMVGVALVPMITDTINQVTSTTSNVSASIPVNASANISDVVTSSSSTIPGPLSSLLSILPIVFIATLVIGAVGFIANDGFRIPSLPSFRRHEVDPSDESYDVLRNTSSIESNDVLKDNIPGDVVESSDAFKDSDVWGSKGNKDAGWESANAKDTMDWGK